MILLCCKGLSLFVSKNEKKLKSLQFGVSFFFVSFFIVLRQYLHNFIYFHSKSLMLYIDEKNYPNSPFPSLSYGHFYYNILTYEGFQSYNSFCHPSNQKVIFHTVLEKVYKPPRIKFLMCIVQTL